MESLEEAITCRRQALICSWSSWTDLKSSWIRESRETASPTTVFFFGLLFRGVYLSMHTLHTGILSGHRQITSRQTVRRLGSHWQDQNVHDQHHHAPESHALFSISIIRGVNCITPIIFSMKRLGSRIPAPQCFPIHWGVSPSLLYSPVCYYSRVYSLNTSVSHSLRAFSFRFSLLLHR